MSTEGRGRKPKSVPNGYPTPTSAVSEGETESDHTDLPGHDDYIRLYEDSRREVLERDAAISYLKATVARLMSERQELVQKLEQLARDYSG